MVGRPRAGIKNFLALRDLTFKYAEAKKILEDLINRQRAWSFSTKPHRAEIIVFSPGPAVEENQAASPVVIELDWGD
jgi:hypothetical protein